MIRYLLNIVYASSLLFLSCQQDTPAPDLSAMDTPNPSSYQYSYLALGDSYTIGESVLESERWGVLLANSLRNNKVSVANPTTIARTGWTTGELLAAIEARKLQGTFDLVSLLIGVNNQYRGQSPELPFRSEFKELLAIAIKFGKGNPANVIVLSIPNWSLTPFGSGSNKELMTKQIAAYNAIIQEECKKANVSFIDITPLTEKAKDDLTYVANDGLHYSGRMHMEWANAALPEALKILK
ncbi:SGNH/GDSL hydrolase family protein [Adhaeribacter aquaticus]|uniref:SGNH/GDSL hydrolase family protein n=1 Tax=Adhaeribacter aquaticus TaxID=299567 RepID=UPI0005540D7E|nr:SGNH/GDSL hydrolase family protein [Adhaeribacter aquaticus]